MELAFITPTAYLERYSKRGDLYLALAHLIDDEGENEYACFHRREAAKGRRVILDNGLFEGAQVSPESLIRRAAAINASVVCAPDILFDSAGTIKEFKQFVRAKHDAGLHFDVMGIPQADNPDEWWECFRFMDLSNSCKLIGLSILSIPKSFQDVARESGVFGDKFTSITSSRVYLLRQLYAYAKFAGRRPTPCHLLGLGESLADIIYANRVLDDVVISNDSSSAFVHGMSGVRYSNVGDLPGGKISERLNFSFDEGQHFFATDVDYNIKKALSWAHADWN